MGKRTLSCIIGALIAIFVLIVFLIYIVQEPPVEQLTQARMNLAKAEKMNSSIYAGIVYKDAKCFYDSAMNKWRSENDKIFFLRKFLQVKQYADKANVLALESINKTEWALININEMLIQKIEELEGQIELYNKIYKDIPLSDIQRNELIKGKILLKEGILVYNKNDYKNAFLKLDSAEMLINRIVLSSKNILEQYFKNYPDWKQKADRSINNSGKYKTTCIIIDKYARKCILYKKGIAQESYHVELGLNWIGDKNYQGDKSTPEGDYKIISKKAIGETRYYKAFLLNYPNKEDKKRFIVNKRNGFIKSNAAIGNFIEIHGHGGKGIDWTDGCIALKDSDMDKLFLVCNIGTEVTILGSLKPLEEIQNGIDENN